VDPDTRRARHGRGHVTLCEIVWVQGGAKTVTFDRSAAKLPRFELLK
jgi:hypothetical protein